MSEKEKNTTENEEAPSNPEAEYRFYCDDDTPPYGDTRESEAMRKLFVGALNRETKDKPFYDYFVKYGEVLDNVIIVDDDYYSRGFGFITYAKSHSLEKVLKSRPHKLDGKALDVKRAMPKFLNTPGNHIKTTKLNVTGFKSLSNFTPQQLQAYIKPRHGMHGRVLKILFARDKLNRLKGYGIVEVCNTDFADRLCISEHEFQLQGATLSICKPEPEPKRDKKNKRPAPAAKKDSEDYISNYGNTREPSPPGRSREPHAEYNDYYAQRGYSLGNGQMMAYEAGYRFASANPPKNMPPPGGPSSAGMNFPPYNQQSRPFGPQSSRGMGPRGNKGKRFPSYY